MEFLSKRKIIGAEKWVIIFEMAKETWPGLSAWNWPNSALLSSNGQNAFYSATLFFFSNTLAK
jgi:hypothetical protein